MLSLVNGGRIAPPFFSGARTAHKAAILRACRFAMAPVKACFDSGDTVGRDLIGNIGANHFGSNTSLRGEQCGPAARIVSGSMRFTTPIQLPSQGPFSVFVFGVNRGSSSIQALVSIGGTGVSGWGLELSYGSSQIGLTRWGLDDWPTTTLGAVPTKEPVTIGMTHNGSVARFSLNGRFESITTGNPNAYSGSAGIALGMTSTGTLPAEDFAMHCCYLWERVLSDAEMLALTWDPWLPIRPELPMLRASITASAIARRRYVSSAIGG